MDSTEGKGGVGRGGHIGSSLGLEKRETIEVIVSCELSMGLISWG